MKRIHMLSTIAGLALIAGAPALAGPGGGHGGGQGGGGPSDQGSLMRDMGRENSQGAINASDRARERANENSAIHRDTTDTTTTQERGRVKGDVKADADSRANGRVHTDTQMKAMAHGNVKLSGVTNGMTVVDSSGATVGTVTNVSTKGNGNARSVQVTLTNGQIITLSPRSLSLNGNVLTTTSVQTNVKSQGAANANINGLIHASPNSALSSAGVTTLTGLNTGFTVNNSSGTSIGTVSQVFMNSTGAVVGVRVDLTGGGSVTLPATSLSMDGTTVITSSTQF